MQGLLVRRLQRRKRWMLQSLFLVLLGFTLWNYWQSITYFLRPVWDVPPEPFKQVLKHYYSPELTMAQRCSLHGWRLRDSPRRVFDAILFSNELDLLEIRWRELDAVTSRFVMLESESTFTGRPKPLFFRDHAANSTRFAFALTKLTHSVVKLDVNGVNEPFDNERRQRRAMDDAIARAGARAGDLIIMADADEIPSAHTIDLLRSCDGFPSPLHLQLSNYIFSFEFPAGTTNWKPAVQVYEPQRTWYGHSRRSESVLVDCGWHCSFCLRSTRDISFKMQAYSHASRVSNPKFLDRTWIQHKLCQGEDLFDMLPEEYSFKELIGKMGAVPSSYSAVNLPTFLLQNAARFEFLLPGNCKRESR